MISKPSIRPFREFMPKIGDRVLVDPTAVVIGNVEIGEDSSIWPLAVIRGDIHYIRIGKRTSIQDSSVLHITHAGTYNPDGYPVTVGDDVTVGHSVILHGCTIGNRVLVGMGSTVMDGAVVKDEVLIGAGSLVTPGKALEGGYLYVGAPCKKVRRLSDKEIEYLTYSAQNYVKLKNEYLKEQN
ncbi:MAG: gamma carbonic anhydrase family protein [Desulfobacterales bacterium]|nr:gamma carbonic anhydrase family protein [Desulfobacterales bacterium]